MKKQKLNYRFHNPNTAEVTADYILKVFIEVNAKKVERVMQEVAGRSLEEDKQVEKYKILEYRFTCVIDEKRVNLSQDN